MKTNDEKTQELIALRKYVRKQLIQTTGIDPYPEILVDNGGRKSAQENSTTQKNG